MYSFLSKRRIHHEEISPDRHPPGMPIIPSPPPMAACWKWPISTPRTARPSACGATRVSPGSSGSLWKRGTASTASGTALRARSWTWPCPASATAPGSTSGPRPRARVSRWQIVEAGGGKVKLRNVLADKVIDLVGMRVENGTQPRSGRMSLVRTSSGSSTCARAPAEQGDPRPDAEGRAPGRPPPSRPGRRPRRKPPARPQEEPVK